MLDLCGTFGCRAVIRDGRLPPNSMSCAGNDDPTMTLLDGRMLMLMLMKVEGYRKEIERLEKEVEEKERRCENSDTMYNRMKDISRNIKSVRTRRWVPRECLVGIAQGPLRRS